MEDEQNEQLEHEKFKAQVMADLAKDDDDDQQAAEGAPDAQDASEQKSKPDEPEQKADNKAEDKQEKAEDEDGLTKAERRALRAARRGERLARQEADRLRKQLEEVTGKQGSGSDADDLDGPDDDVILADLKQDMPTVATRFEKVKEQAKRMAERVRELEARGPQATELNEDDFTPDALPAELQAEVDKVSDLFDWQYDPQSQDKWDMAKQIDGFLIKHPAWKDKPPGERLKETARRVKQELTAAAPKPPDPKPTKQAPQAKAVVQEDDMPETLSGMRGGDTPRNSEPDYSRMSNEDILNSLRYG